MADESHLAAYRSWLLRQPCACQPCVAPVEVHHSTVGETAQHSKSLGGRRGKGQRASDSEGISLCYRHHRAFHDLKGYFGDWEKQQLRDWQEMQVQRLQRAYAMAHPEPAVLPHRPRPTGVGHALASAASVVERATITERLRIAEWLRDRAGGRHLKVNEAAVLTDAASELETQTGDF